MQTNDYNCCTRGIDTLCVFLIILDKSYIIRSGSGYVRKFYKIDLCIIVGLVLLFSFLGYLLFRPKLYLEGKEYIEIEYNTKYVDPGAKVSNLLKNKYHYKVKKRGVVNTKKLGIYTISYKADHLLFNNYVERKVKVVDKRKPHINLVGDKNYYICPNTNYFEVGYSAMDDYDKDITEKVKVRYEKGKIEYIVKDSSGNEARTIRKIIKEDVVPPVVTLNGNEEEHVIVGNTYDDLKVSVLDNCDGKIDNIKVENHVDFNTPGTYEIVYIVKDKAGNESSIKRKVIVEQRKNTLYEEKTIYLTFDDGPGEYTEEILAILKEEGVKATFFITNNGSDETVKRQLKEGHTIGIHTASHDYSYVYLNSTNFFNDFNIVNDRIKRITGQTPKFSRFPGGSNNTVSNKFSYGIMNELKKEVTSRGYTYVDWNISGEDAGSCYNSSDRKSCIYNNVIGNLNPNISNIVLLHDIKEDTKDVLRDIIQTAKKEGYHFKVIDEYAPLVQFK